MICSISALKGHSIIMIIINRILNIISSEATIRLSIGVGLGTDLKKKRV